MSATNAFVNWNILTFMIFSLISISVQFNNETDAGGHVSDDVAVPNVSNLVTSYLNTTALQQNETDTNSTYKASSVNQDETSTDFNAVNKTQESIAVETETDVVEIIGAPFIPNDHEKSNKNSTMKGTAQDSTTREPTTVLNSSSTNDTSVPKTIGTAPNSTIADPESETNSLNTTDATPINPNASSDGFTETDNTQGTTVPNTKTDTDKTTEAPSINNKNETLNQSPNTSGTTPELTSVNPTTVSQSDITTEEEQTTNLPIDSEETSDTTSSSSEATTTLGPSGRTTQDITESPNAPTPDTAPAPAPAGAGTAQEASSTMTMVLIPLILLIVVVAVLVFMVHFRQSLSHNTRFRRHNSRENIMAIKQTAAGIQPPTELKSHVITLDQLLSVDQETLDAEYKELGSLADTFQYTKAAAALDVNKDKNRYINIRPFDYNRVVLPVRSGDTQSDYINASYVKGFSRNKEFIAAQGPKFNTTEAFWRMIWEDNVSIIAMVTNLMEDETPKCAKYWPEIEALIKFGNIEVRNVGEICLDHFVVRHLEAIQNGILRHVKHFQYIDWPDFGCPNNPQDLITFVQAVRSEMDDSFCSSPVVVHCSAGVGRTGTFIAVDWLIQQAKESDCIDVFKVVAELRRYRVLMVQKVEQYKLIYKCLEQFVSSQLKNEKTSKILNRASVKPASTRRSVIRPASRHCETSL